jgi:aspartyl-tRNA(Asn)/glutamyl-tRNA(Gln) amidotransferase subunit A
VSLWELPALDAVADMRAMRLTVTDYLEAHLQRIDATEPLIRAWACLDVEGARATAAYLDTLPLHARDGLLFGLPVGLKDVIDVAGLPTGADFAPLEQIPVDRDSAIAERLRSAGAVILGKLVTTPFAWSFDQPKTRNPWNLEYTPGGSSSGSAAAVAAGHVPIAIGTQTLGSLMRPSSYNGVVGLKPSYGRLSCFGVSPTSWSSDHPGIVARSVEVAEQVFLAVSGHDPRDPHSMVIGAEPAAPPQLSLPLRVGVLQDFVDRTGPEETALFTRAVGLLNVQEIQLVDTRLPVDLDLLAAMQATIQSVESVAIHMELFHTNADDYRSSIRANFESAALIPGAVYVHAKRWRRVLEGPITALTGQFDCLMAPVSPKRAPRVDRHATEGLGDASFLPLSSAFGLPALSLPTGLGPDGLPSAIQLIGQRGQDRKLLAVATRLQSILSPVVLSPTVRAADRLDA